MYRNELSNLRELAIYEGSALLTSPKVNLRMAEINSWGHRFQIKYLGSAPI
jgi:hypothetical protein